MNGIKHPVDWRCHTERPKAAILSSKPSLPHGAVLCKACYTDCLHYTRRYTEDVHVMNHYNRRRSKANCKCTHKGRVVIPELKRYSGHMSDFYKVLGRKELTSLTLELLLNTFIRSYLKKNMFIVKAINEEAWACTTQNCEAVSKIVELDFPSHKYQSLQQFC